MSHLSRLLSGFFLVILSGCFQVPESNPRLQPVQPVDRWVRGKAYLKQTQNDLDVTVAFLDSGPNSLLFDVVVANRGQAPVLVDPERVFCVLEGVPPGTPGPREVAAVDPERMILQLDKAAAVERTAKANHAVFGGVFLLVNVADALSNDRYRSEHERREERREFREVSRDLNDMDRASDRRLEGISGTRRYWEEDCVRKTTLEPGSGLRGKVVFHCDTRKAGRLILRVPVESSVFQVEFRKD